MSLEQQTLEKAVAELELTPTQREYLDAALSTYQELKFDYDSLEHLMDIEKMTIGKILEEAGVDKAKTDEFSLCWIRGATTSKLDPMKLIAQGVTSAQIAAATVTKPKKPYFQIRGKHDKVSEPGRDE